MSLILSQALSYADLELPVIPLKRASKLPAIARWPERATTDRTQIRRWFGGGQDRNIGIAMGGGLVAIDIDPSDGGEHSLATLASGRDMPRTATAATGGNGRHLVYRVTRPIGNLVGFRPGIDVRGAGGMIVAEPSVHPETLREYVWLSPPSMGIAECPRWLLELLDGGRECDNAGKGLTCPRPVGGRRGDADCLSSEIMARFPVTGHGRRNDAMMRSVASLVGRGFDDGLIVESVTSWWRHFYRLGLARTSPVSACREITATIRSARSNPQFLIATRDHRSEVSAIRLSAAQRELLSAELASLGHPDYREPKGGPLPHNHKRVTLTRGRLCNRVCSSDDERAFVEALVVQVTHKLETESGELIRMTNEQVREVAADRFGVIWTSEQFERLKRKYVWRPDKPAARLELLREVEKGDRRTGQKVGTPSIYRPTGVAIFLNVSHDLYPFPPALRV